MRHGVTSLRVGAGSVLQGQEIDLLLFLCSFSLFVEKLPSHRDYQQCSAIPEKQLIMKVTADARRQTEV